METSGNSSIFSLLLERKISFPCEGELITKTVDQTWFSNIKAPSLVSAVPELIVGMIRLVNEHSSAVLHRHLNSRIVILVISILQSFSEGQIYLDFSYINSVLRFKCLRVAPLLSKISNRGGF